MEYILLWTYIFQNYKTHIYKGYNINIKVIYGKLSYYNVDMTENCPEYTYETNIVVRF